MYFCLIRSMSIVYKELNGVYVIQSKWGRKIMTCDAFFKTNSAKTPLHLHSIYALCSIMVAQTGCRSWVRTRARACIFFFPREWVVVSNLSFAIRFLQYACRGKYPGLLI